MTYLIDTDWVASWLNGQKAAITLLRSLTDEGIAISLITFGEIYEGIYYGRDPKVAGQTFLRFLRAVPVIPINKTMMRHSARIRGDLRSKGLLISDTDILIGTTALYYNMTLVTRNMRHFERIANLQIYKAG